MRWVWASLPQGRSLLVLVLAVFVVDSLDEDTIFHPEWGFDSYEITIPKKLGLWRSQQNVDSPVSYLLEVEGKKRVLHLRPKRFLLPRHLRVFSFTEQGELLEDHPYIPNDCNYMGSVEGSKDSEVTISTCMGGLRGVLNIDAKHYQIEPLKASSSFEHVVYLLKKEQLSNHSCGLSNSELEGRMGRIKSLTSLRDYHGSYTHPKYLELVLLFDQHRYRFVNNNLSQVINDAILLTGIMDTYFQDVHVRIHLKALEVWTDYNRIYLGYPNLAEVLGRFILYRNSVLNGRLPADWAHLYIHRKYTDALAWSFGRVCSQDHAGSASSLLDANILGPATWSTHELGHAVGMLHDEEYCQCKGRLNCIMGTGRTGFSNCSYIYFFAHINSGANCLNNIPGMGFVVKRCGNKLLEEDEECDCGSTEDCKENKCCHSNCTLRQGAKCSIGLCCHDCHFRPSGYICRQEKNECDLAEYCDGNSSFCPSDFFKQDGTPCKYEGRCFNKGCRSRFMQCQSIFGPDAREAPHQCYEAVNIMGDQYGNCEITGVRTYKGCDKQNAICGRLQCINVKTLPNLPEHTTIISSHLRAEKLVCWGTGYHLAMRPLGIPDVGVIYDGTSCGDNQICFNKNCINSSVLNFDCLPEKCNARGVCNNKRNCHCMYGWAPPFCEEEGYGGSIDSGPPGPLKVEVSSSIAIVFIMIFRLLLLVISVIFVYFRETIENFLKPKEQATSPEKAENKEPTANPGDKTAQANAGKTLKKEPGNPKAQ
ncbi:disintegrin and metalloproteinase domain-containing protein 30 [Microcebus murinus]|uniref:disintegrin and metalloproteinase domain-containing protein 30 n=1 Tax=Microcebus murinus TaxID=30608 RepID=UPI003F6C49E8